MEITLSELDAAVALVDSTDAVTWESTNCEKILGVRLAEMRSEGIHRRCHVDDARVAAEILRTGGEIRWWVDDSWRQIRLTRVGMVGNETVVVLCDVTRTRSLVERIEVLGSLLDASVELSWDGSVIDDTLGMSAAERSAFADTVSAVGETGLVSTAGRVWQARIGHLSTGALVGLRDMSDADRSLRRDALWRRVVESLAEGFWLLDEQRLVMDCNTTALSMLGLTLPDVLGKSMLEVSQKLAQARPGSTVMLERGGSVVYLECTRTVLPLGDTENGEVLVVRDVTKEAELAEALAMERATLGELNEELRAVVAAIANARGRERAAIARRLHDDPIQRLAALRWRLSGADPLAATELEECYEALRQVVFDLRPQTLIERGLTAALCEMEALDERVEVTAEGVDGVDPDIGDLVWRNIREAVRNAIMHSGATSIKVAVARQGEMIMCEVRDDGCGVTPEGLRLAERRGHIGVASVRETVAEAGGRFYVIGVNKGTTLRMDVPGRWTTS
jgi:PAS domain S-box-containing protein